MNINGSQAKNYRDLYEQFRKLSREYSDMPMDNIMAAYVRASSRRTHGMFTADPYIQNRRVKEMKSLPGASPRTRLRR